MSDKSVRPLNGSALVVDVTGSGARFDSDVWCALRQLRCTADGTPISSPLIGSRSLPCLSIIGLPQLGQASSGKTRMRAAGTLRPGVFLFTAITILAERDHDIIGYDVRRRGERHAEKVTRRHSPGFKSASAPTTRDTSLRILGQLVVPRINTAICGPPRAF